MIEIATANSLQMVRVRFPRDFNSLSGKNNQIDSKNFKIQFGGRLPSTFSLPITIANGKRTDIKKIYCVFQADKKTICETILVEKNSILARSCNILQHDAFSLDSLKDLASKFRPCKNLTRNYIKCKYFTSFFAMIALLAWILQGTHFKRDLSGFFQRRQRKCIIL